jgi:hypothetical protein
MRTTTSPRLEDFDGAAAPTRRGSSWTTLLSAGLLGLVAGCSAAGGQGGGAGSAPPATASSSGALSSAASGSGASTSSATSTASPVAPSSAGSFRAACTSRVLLPLMQRKFDDPSAGVAIVRVQIERCRNGYARVFAIPRTNPPGQPQLESEQVFLRYLNGSWRSVSQGTGLSCSDPDASRALLGACTALGYATTAHLDRISDPQVAADRLVQAWMRHDSAAAGQLTRDESPIEVLFSHRAPTTAPEAIPCRLLSPGRFACSYTLAPHAQLTIVVAGGASAGYEVTGLEFGD